MKIIKVKKEKKNQPTTIIKKQPKKEKNLKKEKKNQPTTIIKKGKGKTGQPKNYITQ